MIAQIPPDEAARLLEANPDAVYLDVRTEAEFGAGHPAGAWNIPVVFFDPSRRTIPNADFQRVAAAVLAKEKKVIVGCAMGARSQRAAEILRALGFTDVVNVDGGFGGRKNALGIVAVTGWKDRGLPVETGTPAGRSYDDLKKRA